MKTSVQEKKARAVEVMKALDFYYPYIDAFKNKGDVMFFRGFGGYHPTDAERDVCEKIKEFEEEYNGLVYAVIHHFAGDDECYAFLYVPDHKEEWSALIDKIECRGSRYYAFSYVWNRSDDLCSEFGDVVVEACGGGIRRAG